MKKIILAFLLTLACLSSYSQTVITSGMTGTQLKNALNSNFNTVYDNVDTLLNGDLFNGTRIGRVTEASRIDSAIIDGYNLKLYHGTTLLNSGSGVYYNVTYYGAKGDSITNDATAITNCINDAIANNGIVYFPSGDYVVSGNKTFYVTRKNIRIIGSGKVNIIGNQSTWSFASSYGASTTFKYNPTIGTPYLMTTSLYSSVEEGDILSIESTKNIVNTTLPYYKGELVKVKKVNGDVISLTMPLFDTYDKTNTIIKNLNAGSVSIENINFYYTAVNTSQCQNVEINNCNWINTHLTAFSPIQSYNVNITNNTIEADTLGGVYGIGISSSQNVYVNNNRINNYSQAIEAGGSWPSRNLTYSNNLVSCFTEVAGQIGVHATCQYVRIVGNRIWNGGIYAAGQNIDIVGNVITLGYGKSHISRNFGIERVEEDLVDDATHPAPYSRYLNIIDNTIMSTDEATGDQIGMFIGIVTFRDTVDYIRISGNYVKVGGYALLVQGHNEVSNLTKNMIIQNNYLEQTKSTGEYYTVLFNQGFRVTDLIFDNNVVRSAEYGSYMGSMFAENVTIRNCTFYPPGHTSPQYGGMSVLSSGAKNLDVYNNKFDSCYLSIGGFQLSRVINNTFTGMADIHNAISANTDSLYLSDNSYDAVIAAVTGGATNIFRNETDYMYGPLTDGTPTNTEINAICGETAATMRRGYKLIIMDSTGTKLTYTYMSDGTSWILQGAPIKAL